MFALEQPTYVAVMTDAHSETLRRDFYEAWSTRASERGPTAGKFDNTAVMNRILALRHEAAQLLDFPNYAAYALATRMAPSNQAVFDFLRQLVRVARPAAKREFAELEAFAGRRLNAWDVSYYSEKLQQKLFSISQEELRPYFPLPRVLEGLFSVAEQLFGVKIVERKGVPALSPRRALLRNPRCAAASRAPASIWMPARAPKKRAGAWMDDCVGRKDFGAEHTVPVAYLVCNFLPAGAGQARAAHARRRRDDVPRVRSWPAPHAHARGLPLASPASTACPGMRSSCRASSWRISRGAPRCSRRWRVISKPASRCPRTSRRSCSARARSRPASRPCASSSSRCSISACTPNTTRRRGARVHEILAEVRDEVAVFAVPEWNRFPHNFGHIFAGGYAAGYYSYKWAEVLSRRRVCGLRGTGRVRQARSRSVSSTPSCRRAAAKKALDAFVDFRGRPPDVNALLQPAGPRPVNAATMAVARSEAVSSRSPPGT